MPFSHCVTTMFKGFLLEGDPSISLIYSMTLRNTAHECGREEGCSGDFPPLSKCIPLFLVYFSFTFSPNCIQTTPASTCKYSNLAFYYPSYKSRCFKLSHLQSHLTVFLAQEYRWEAFFPAVTTVKI